MTNRRKNGENIEFSPFFLLFNFLDDLDWFFMLEKQHLCSCAVIENTRHQTFENGAGWRFL